MLLFVDFEALHVDIHGDLAIGCNKEQQSAWSLLMPVALDLRWTDTLAETESCFSILTYYERCKYDSSYSRLALYVKVYFC